MSVKDDAIEITVAVVALALAVWYIESRFKAAGGVTGLSSSLFSYATGSLFSGGDPTPSMGAIPDQTTLNTTNATSSDTVNSLLNSSLTMQSIGM
ncbi:hypothetical protein SAMN02787142_1256 [Burkholderia sp. WP9]|uniref:hypothetical protein n=1 Tax=Burkholderia sp. WP9 TaxID=1500263 RepID=UPI0008983EA4|nr:hypothetical protein [Burkholderia sp. WP9]SEC36119.1 hypothetical protein SAMN02787142_1256 [Burkholderia sp. WP9]